VDRQRLVEPPVRAGEGDRRGQRPDHLSYLGVRPGGEKFGNAGVKAALVDAAGGVQLLQELRGPVLGVLAHWCTILVSVIFDGSLMHPWCRQVIALLA
jgi:hypothetical protein